MKTDINSNDILVVIDDQIQEYGIDYTIIDGDVKHTTPPKAGAIIKVYKRKEHGKTNN